LGIPANPVMALMIGALMIQGIQPGPTIITEQASLFWGVVVSMWVGNVFLLVLNLPLIGLWVRMISVPYHLLYPAIMVFCAIGVFSISNTTFDVYLMALFGLLGYIFRKLGCEPTPLLLGFILGPPMEEHLRRAMVLSEGRIDVLLREPISALLLATAVVLLASVLLPAVRKKREETFVSEG
jgi:putative tricarboxylic transport membrane protein